MSGSALSFSASLSAMSRGFILAALASTRAALLARSPCAASRGGDTSTLAKSSPAGSAPSLCRACRAAMMRACTSAWTFMGDPEALGSKVSCCRAGLTQFRGSVKQRRCSLMAKRSVMPATKSATTVARSVSLPACLGGGAPGARHLAGLRHVAREQVAHDRLGARHDAHDAGVAIDIGEQIGLAALRSRRAAASDAAITGRPASRTPRRLCSPSAARRARDSRTTSSIMVVMMRRLTS